MRPRTPYPPSRSYRSHFVARVPRSHIGRIGCEVPVGGRHTGSGTQATVFGRGSGTWATLAPAPPRHLSIRVSRAECLFAVDEQVRDEGGGHRAGGAGARGTAV